MTVALDKSAEDARPYIERAAPRHPALVDTEHVTADLFNIINVPTMIWIDEHGRIVRPNDVQFGTDLFVALTGRPSEPFLAADAEAGVAVLGASAGDRASQLASMEAPDFTLPDLEGHLHSLRDQRGKKTLLIAWASW